MSAVIVDIADAVLATIEAATLSLPFTGERVYVPVHDLRDATGIKVSVVPTGIDVTQLDRHRDDFDYVVDVGVQRRIGTGPMTQAEINTACDPLMVFVEEIIDLFRGQSVAYAVYDDDARCVAVANNPVYVPQHVDEHRVFTSVVTLTFRLAR